MKKILISAIYQSFDTWPEIVLHFEAFFLPVLFSFYFCSAKSENILVSPKIFTVGSTSTSDWLVQDSKLGWLLVDVDSTKNHKLMLKRIVNWALWARNNFRVIPVYFILHPNYLQVLQQQCRIKNRARTLCLLNGIFFYKIKRAFKTQTCISQCNFETSAFHMHIWCSCF